MDEWWMDRKIFSIQFQASNGWCAGGGYWFSLNLRGNSTLNLLLLASKEKLGHEYIMAPRQCPKNSHIKAQKKCMNLHMEKCFVCFPLKNAVEQDLYVLSSCQVCDEVFFHNLGE
jgi:hypothetical protein